MKNGLNGDGLFIIVLVTFLISAFLVPIVKKIAFHVNAIDYPNERKVHAKPMPRLGGLAIFLAFLTGYMLFAQEMKGMLGIIMGGFLLLPLSYLLRLLLKVRKKPLRKQKKR